MAKISPRMFVGTRIRAVRLSNATVIDGWIEKCCGLRVEIETSSSSTLQIGERFRFALNGKNTSARFDGVLDDFYPSTTGKRSDPMAITDGANALAVQPEFWTMVLSIKGSFRPSGGNQEFRVKKTGVLVSIRQEGGSEDGEIVDIGPHGFSCRVETGYKPGMMVSFEIQTSLGPVSGDATVKNCRKLDATSFRVGIHIDDMGRIDGLRWKRYVFE